jgi:hypothetical protein
MFNGIKVIDMMLKPDVYRLRYIGCSTPCQAMNQSASNLNRIFPLRLDFKERQIACLNWSRVYTCSTAADSGPLAIRPASFW